MTPATEQGRRTEKGYWDNVWLDKSTKGWARFAWIEGSYVHTVLDRMLAARLARGPRRFLELGCGTGKWLIYFQKRFGYTVTGCDYSDVSCDMTRRNLEEAGVEGTVVQGDMFALTGQYDVVFSTGLIEHFDEPDTVLKKFVSLLAPGGTLISLVPNLGGLSGFYHRRWKPETFDTHRPISLAELRRWYGDLGLRNVDTGALGSVIPQRFPRDKIRREHPALYRILYNGFLRPTTWGVNRACLWAYRHTGFRPESERVSPHLYAIGERG
jgi:2-polyprenyl-6-hydroxyphenyl methylase/3-demethylubiquinone-9 3-methyltransferase